MRTISDTITRMAALRARASGASVTTGSSRLARLEAFGSNPGSLVGKTYIPSDLPDGAALVVVLHGCTQSADAYDVGSGWSTLADEDGFAVLFPEQQRSNNANLCFNWFVPSDTRRDSGEVSSIRQMIDTVATRHRIDPDRIFVTGLSAGGAMAGAMLAAYPEVFAGGAIIAGLPYGTAATVPEAFDRMRGHGTPPAAVLQGRLAAASDHAGPWPKLSIWHGDADATVAVSNADAIAAQWRAAHRLPDKPHRTEIVRGHTRKVWSDMSGEPVMESYTIAGMGHGTPIDPRGDRLGTSGPFMLEAGISSTRHVADFFGITAGAKVVSGSARPTKRDPAPGLDGEIILPGTLPKETAASAAPPRETPPQAGSDSVSAVIEKALRAAGLMR